MQIELQGKITTWNDKKGFGFITPLSGGDRIFVHIKALKQRHQHPRLGQIVHYTVSKDKQGRTCAAGVSFAGKGHPSPQRTMQKTGAFVFVGLLFAVLAVFTWALQMFPLYLIGLYTTASAITFIAYAIDKSSAQKGRWRTRESTLHMLSLLGGWPGALIAQQTLRHKTRKAGFQWTFKFTVLLNVAITAWLLTPGGPERTRAFLEKVFR